MKCERCDSSATRMIGHASKARPWASMVCDSHYSELVKQADRFGSSWEPVIMRADDPNAIRWHQEANAR